jgi:predicted nucleic acid-binding protein
LAAAAAAAERAAEIELILPPSNPVDPSKKLSAGCAAAAAAAAAGVPGVVDSFDCRPWGVFLGLAVTAAGAFTADPPAPDGVTAAAAATTGMALLVNLPAGFPAMLTVLPSMLLLLLPTAVALPA